MPFTNSGYLNMMDLLIRRYSGFSFNRGYHLSTNVPAGDPAEVVEADFTECDFDGYGVINNPTYPDPSINGDGRGELVSPSLIWTAGSGIAGAQTAKAIYFCCDTELVAGVDKLMWWQELDPWVTVANEGETIEQIITWLDRNFTP